MDESPEHHLQAPPTAASTQIQAQPTTADASAPPSLPNYDFRKRRWKLWGLLTLLLVSSYGVGSWWFAPDPGPPLTVEDAQQALLEIVDDPRLVHWRSAKSSFDQPTFEYGGVGRFGDYYFDLPNRVFEYETPGLNRPRQIRGRFVYENGGWKAKFGGTGDYRRFPQISG